MLDTSSRFLDKSMERTEISAFFLTPFTLAGVKILHLHENCICRCTAHDEGQQNGARIKSMSPTVSDLCSQKKQSTSSSSYASKKILRIKKGT